MQRERHCADNYQTLCNLVKMKLQQQRLSETGKEEAGSERFLEGRRREGSASSGSPGTPLGRGDSSRSKLHFVDLPDTLSGKEREGVSSFAMASCDNEGFEAIFVTSGRGGCEGSPSTDLSSWMETSIDEPAEGTGTTHG